MKPATRVQLAAEQLGGEYYTSKRGVPIVILTLPDGSQGNLCYFGRKQTWRWFYPSWRFDVEPSRTDFGSLENFAEFWEGEA